MPSRGIPEAPAAPCRILIVDDHPLVRQGLAQLFQSTRDLVLCGEAQDENEARNLIRTSKPDLVLLDLGLGNTGGITALRTLHRQFPSVPVLVLSMHDELLYAERALKAGARGYVMKSEPPKILIEAIRAVLSGETFLSRDATSQAIEALARGTPAPGSSPSDLLSERELEVFKLLGRGLSSRRIAGTLHLSIKTVEAHRDHIRRKLSLRDSSELIQRAALWAREERLV